MRTLRLTLPFLEGADVKQVQRLVGATVDGVFGPETQSKVIDFQAKMNLVPDGVVGPKTWAALQEYSGEQPVSVQPVTAPATQLIPAATDFSDKLLIAGSVLLLAAIGIAVYRNSQ